MGRPVAQYNEPLPENGEPKRAILDTYTKQHSVEYQSQALIDLARRMSPSIKNLSAIESIIIHTGSYTHNVIGTGANDPQKMNPDASREALDRSITYIFAVALQDRGLHHQASYPPIRTITSETLALWRKISTVEDAEWTRRYHSHDPQEKAFGGRVVVKMKDGSTMLDAIVVADAHPLGALPFGRPQYVAKFRSLADGVLPTAEQDRFLEMVERLTHLKPDDLAGLTFTVEPSALGVSRTTGLFDWKRRSAAMPSGTTPAAG
jgi:2-methylcitrate dehydratase